MMKLKSVSCFSQQIQGQSQEFNHSDLLVSCPLSMVTSLL